MSPTPVRNDDVPTPEEVLRIIHALPPPLRPLVGFIAETGCRAGEAFNLTWNDLDLDASRVRFGGREGWTPKTASSNRTIPISGELRTCLQALPRLGLYVFSGADPNRPIGSIAKAFRSAVQKAGIARGSRALRVTPQTLRKATATWLALAGLPHRLLQAKLGHAPGSFVTDRFYVQAGEDALRKAIMPLPGPISPPFQKWQESATAGAAAGVLASPESAKPLNEKD
jgi:integrase